MSDVLTEILNVPGKRVVVWGLGAEGLVTVAHLRRNYPKVSVEIVDRNPEAARQSLAAAFDAGVAKICVLPEPGPEPESVPDCDLIIKSPGVSLYHQAIQGALDQGVVCTSGTNIWMLENPQVFTIGVTGTKGKSTTSSLLAHMLRALGKRVELAGNIGTPLLGLGAEMDICVIELSSYQCADFAGHLNIALLLNLSEEHLDWHGDMARYSHDKARLLASDLADLAITSADLVAAVRQLTGRKDVQAWNTDDGYQLREDRIFRGEEQIVANDDLLLRGGHNLKNVAAAFYVMQQLGFATSRLAAPAATFAGLAHRLQSVGCIAGVQFVDDSISTTPVATLAAIKSIACDRLFVIVGGFDRGLSWVQFAEAVAARPGLSVLGIPDTGEQAIAALSSRGMDCQRLSMHADLESAVRSAFHQCLAGDVILLSPGAPSFGQFKDYIARAEQFVKCMRDIDDRI